MIAISTDSVWESLVEYEQPCLAASEEGKMYCS